MTGKQCSPVTVHWGYDVYMDAASTGGATKAALAAAKARGAVLGGWRGGSKIAPALGTEARRGRADAFATGIRPMVAEMRERGFSLRKIGAELTDKGIRTLRGGEWTAAAVRAVLVRVDART